MYPHYSIDWLKEKYETDTPLKFLFFWGHTPKEGSKVDKSCFSQWFDSSFVVNGITYHTAEHWMMAQKALLFKDTHNYERIIQCRKPGEAKAIGREVLGYTEDVWNAHRFEIVKQGNWHKFSQHPDLAEFLLKTDNRILVEASPVDAIWGIGLQENDKRIGDIAAWPGLNLLGFALMEVRDHLKRL